MSKVAEAPAPKRPRVSTASALAVVKRGADAKKERLILAKAAGREPTAEDLLTLAQLDRAVELLTGVHTHTEDDVIFGPARNAFRALNPAWSAAGCPGGLHPYMDALAEALHLHPLTLEVLHEAQTVG